MTLNEKLKQFKIEIFWYEEDKMFVAKLVTDGKFKYINALGYSPIEALAELYVICDVLDMDEKIKEENKKPD